MTPLERYHAEGARPDFVQDPDQLAAIARLDALYHALMDASRTSRRRWSWWPAPRIVPPRGLYLWGGVGRGKTFVVDTFCASLPDSLRVRVHFHSFMRDVHARLRQLRGAQDPLRKIAAGWSREMRLLCLDEFHVVDITDAMLLGQLLAALFARGVTLVTTSNEAPDDLYRGGLQRERFLPAIATLKQHLEVFEFGGATDYRWRTLTRAATYYTPADAAAERALADCWLGLTRQTPSLRYRLKSRAGRYRFARGQRAPSGSRSATCAKGRGARSTTSKSRAAITPFSCRACLVLAMNRQTRRDASSIWWTSSTTVASICS